MLVKRVVKPLIALVGGAMMVGQAGASVSEAQLESYQLIPERNAFGLRPLPPPVDPNATNAPTPASKVFFTGIVSNQSTGAKKAYFKIPDLAHQGAFTYITLGEGEQEGALRVVEGGIDEKAGTAKIMNAGMLMTVSFDKDGNQAGAGPAVAGAPAGANATALVNAPGKIPPPPGMILPAAAGGRAVSFPPAVGPTGGSASSTDTGSGITTIPTRSIRTAPVATVQAAPPQTAEESIINMEVQRQLNAPAIATGNFPPLPPTPLSEGLGGNPPALPIPGKP